MSDWFTCLRIPTPFAIGAVNVYLIHGDSPTLIDTGPDWPRARQALTAALAEEGLSPKDITRVLVTHGHSDHSGLSGWFQSMGAEIYMHPDEAAKLSGVNLFALRNEFLQKMGIAPDALESFARVGENNFNATILEFQPLTANQHIDVGRFVLTALPVPGHCGGHMAFYSEEHQLLFGGDALLKDVSPNPLPEVHMGMPGGRTRSLGTYFSTLTHLEELPLSVVMPGHGEPVLEPAQRIAQVRNLHRERLGKVLTLLGPGSTPYELARQLYGPLNGWDVFLAVAEACAHLDWLADGGWVEETRPEPGDTLLFIPTGKPWPSCLPPGIL